MKFGATSPIPQLAPSTITSSGSGRNSNTTLRILATSSPCMARVTNLWAKQELHAVTFRDKELLCYDTRKTRVTDIASRGTNMFKTIILMIAAAFCSSLVALASDTVAERKLQQAIDLLE